VNMVYASLASYKREILDVESYEKAQGWRGSRRAWESCTETRVRLVLGATYVNAVQQVQITAMSQMINNSAIIR
jgi:hypothetical protein